MLNKRAIVKLCEYSPSTLYAWLERRRPEILSAPDARTWHGGVFSAIKRCKKCIEKISKRYHVDIVVAEEATAATVVLPDHNLPVIEAFERELGVVLHVESAGAGHDEKHR